MSSYWFDAVPDKKRYPALEKNIEVNTAIVGGGLAGLTVAYFLAKGGQKVAVFEQGALGSGDTSYTTAFISHFLDNADATKKVWQVGDEVLDFVENIVREEKINCEFKRLDSISFTRKNKDGLKSDFLKLSLLDPSMKFLEEEETAQLYGFGAETAMLIKGEGKFHIRKYIFGLAEAIVRQGGEIFEETKILKIEDGGKKISTKNSEVSAQKTVLSVGLPFQFPEVAKLLTPYLTFVIGAKFAKPLPFKDFLFWDDEEPYHYFRWVSDSEVILGGEDRAVKGPKPLANPHEELIKFLKEITGKDPEILHKWQGSIFMTENSLPYYGAHSAYGENILFAAGFGGNGMTFGSFAGRIISDIILGKKNNFISLFSFNRNG